MKNRKLIPLYLLIILGLPGILDGCKKVEDGLSSISWQINFDLVTTTWDIQFIDAATGLPIGSNGEERIEVVISGGDQQNILDLAGIRQPTFYSTKGVLALALHPNRLAPQATTPVSFVIHAKNPSYLPATIPILTYHEGINPVQVYMVNRNSTPANVDMLVQTQAGNLVNGRLTDSLDIHTSGNMASLQMSAGTEVVTVEGSQLSGNLTFAFSHWEGGTTNGLKTFPGGQIAVNDQGHPGLIYLACGIYVDIQDNDGNLAGRISKPIQGTALIDQSVYNPFTKTKLTAGAAVPVWFLNQLSGVWESKGTTILQLFQNKLLANFSMESPGMLMIGWINEDLCPFPLVLHPNTLPEYNVIPYTFTLNIFELYGEELRFVRSVGISGQVNQDYDLRFLPDNSELVFRFEQYTGEDKPYYKSPDPILLAGFCQSGSPADFDLLPKPNSSFKKIEVVFIDVQHNNTRYYPKVFPGYYRRTGTSTWQSAFVYNGQAYMVNPQQGDHYEMGINFKGEFHLKEVTVGPEEVVLVEIEID
jgi:hypothetical protein